MSNNKYINTIPNPNDIIRLFCFPYAGGSSSVYNSWAKSFSSRIGVYPLQLPGREWRIAESPIDNMNTLISEILPELTPFLDKPFILFGHSMGAKIVYALSKELIALHFLPSAIIFSGALPPNVPPQNPLYDNPDSYLIEDLKRLSGTPSELLDNKEFMSFILPMLRADYTLTEKYTDSTSYCFHSPLLILGGQSDPETTLKGLQEWKTYTNIHCHIKLFEGNHFFIFENPDCPKFIESFILSFIEH